MRFEAAAVTRRLGTDNLVGIRAAGGFAIRRIHVLTWSSTAHRRFNSPLPDCTDDLMGNGVSQNWH
jgi:hypothetical protein